MRALDRGEDFIVTRNGVPVGELRPARRRFVSRDLLVLTFRTAPAIDPDRFRDDLDCPFGSSAATSLICWTRWPNDVST